MSSLNLIIKIPIPIYFSKFQYPVLFGGPTPGADKDERAKEVLGWLNDFIKPTGYVAGTDHLTVADLALLASFSTMAATENFDMTDYPETTAWFEKVKGEVPNYETACGEGAAAFGAFFKSKKE